MTGEPKHGSSAVIPDSEIDREAYERECLTILRTIEQSDLRWAQGGFELLEASLAGGFPDTLLKVRARTPRDASDLDEEWSIWHDEGAALSSGDGKVYRWAPKQLVLNCLQDWFS